MDLQMPNPGNQLQGTLGENRKGEGGYGENIPHFPSIESPGNMRSNLPGSKFSEIFPLTHGSLPFPSREDDRYPLYQPRPSSTPYLTPSLPISFPLQTNPSLEYLPNPPSAIPPIQSSPMTSQTPHFTLPPPPFSRNAPPEPPLYSITTTTSSSYSMGRFVLKEQPSARQRKSTKTENR
jgi:hypothetical protein